LIESQGPLAARILVRDTVIANALVAIGALGAANDDALVASALERCHAFRPSIRAYALSVHEPELAIAIAPGRVFGDTLAGIVSLPSLADRVVWPDTLALVQIRGPLATRVRGVSA
jgi:hypothetical protein